ncbi:UDP-N-acetylmuramoyl-L-alanyl-D-glutamate--2,6-diaminopimelate ligase [Candidatus Pelagibacter sp.]|nr:UDP-N-acetylmuramoyl-L-alanyl-D-glutamate--2,6-diaminopimelate ligase [Candidatus Pelagibacter sp.]
MLLGKLIKNIKPAYKSIKFNNIRFNSKDCKTNDIFFSIQGNKLNGNDYIKDAIKNGSKIIISNLNFEGFNKEKILFIKNKNPRKALAEAASNFYKKKPKNIIALTGTNGKTSIANFFYQILSLSKKKVAAIGTLGVLSKKIKLKTNNTTIDPIKMHQILRKLKNLNIDNVIIEASSHGLKQHRLDGLNLKTALFTNLSRDHLDYHKTFKDYLNSKLILFDKLLLNRGNIIFENGISQEKELKKISKKRKLKIHKIGGENSFINLKKIQKINDKKRINFCLLKKDYSFNSYLIGSIQIKNLLFAILAAYLSGIKIGTILKNINKIKPINGRLEQIGKLKNKSRVILDYAHTPDALKTVILNIKEDYPLSKISLVFGCGGDRDKSKRPLMGSIANKYCDKIYLTDDNPRFENPKVIRDQIKRKIKKKKYVEISSRASAISKAVSELNSGDVLIIAGKGHENYQEYKKRSFFSDKLEIIKAIRKKNNLFSNSLKTNILNETFNNKILNKKTLINSVSLNSKEVKKNSVFFGVKGQKFDGNKFGIEAIKNKAILTITNKKFKNPRNIFSKNPLEKLNKLSSVYRKSLDSNNIAITGSAGKTSVKDLTGFCLKKLDKTYFSRNSFNNKFGVPLSIINSPQTTKFSVLEVGMDKKGEIDALTKLIRPNLGLITNISYAHIKNFKSLDEIAKAKGEIINNIFPSGVMIINKDDKYCNYFISKAKMKNLNVITFSKKNNLADVVYLSERKKKNEFLCKFLVKGKIKFFMIPDNLISFKENILSTLSIITNYFNIDSLPVNLFLNFKISQSRGSIIKYKKGQKNLTIIDESYNSNPLSFKFALERFDKSYKNRKKKFILIGNMLELGKFSKKLHIKIAKYINKSNINKTYVYGNYTKHTFNKLKPQMRGKILNNKLEILNLIKKQLPNNSFLMIKGSNSTGLNKIIKNL